VRLTILGSSASFAGAGQACAGYLVEHGETKVLFDCGNGVVANLACVADPLAIDAVFITHEHPDHFLDLYALQALLRYAPGGPAAPLPLWAPPGLLERMGCLLSERGREELAEAFVLDELVEHATVTVGELYVTPVHVVHTPSTFALIAEIDGGARLCYTSDTRPCPEVLVAATGATLLLAEATLPEEFRGRAPHLTATEAGGLAREAGVGRLVMTHIWPTNDRERMLVEARAMFGPAVSIAEEFAVYEL
jgi:ribonuclease BN (tRNA processing enzyme)